MGSIDISSIRRKIKRSKSFERRLTERAEEKFEESKREAIRDFLNHPVTKELQNPNGSNVSSTLGGYGNLFSFIGFESSSDPIVPVLNSFERLFNLRKRKIIETVDGVEIIFTIQYPEAADLESVSQMPWGGGSWVTGIETSIPGFGYYMLKRAQAARSGQAIQVDAKIRSSSFKRVEYITKITKDFRKSIFSN